MTRTEIIKHAPPEEECAFLEEEFDEALVGFQYVGRGFEIVYDECKIVDVLQRTQKFTRTEAWEWFDFNIARLPVNLAFKEAMDE